MRVVTLGSLVLLLGACDGAGATDAGATDAGANDASAMDAGAMDGGAPLVDAGDECTGAEDGVACGTGHLCLEQACVESSCGDGVTDPVLEDCDDNDVEGDGCTACVFDCTSNADCIDADLCNGSEICDVSHRCVAGTPVVCNDSNACTADTCNTSGSCTFVLIDGDGDGYASNALGVCGTDCNDARNDVYPGATEQCDLIDHDCNGSTTAPATPVWYVDCDDDGYATGGAASMVTCTEPAATGCGGGWTTRVPGTGAADCNDLSALVRPGATEVRDDGVDQNCDGAELCYTDADSDGYYLDGSTVSVDLDCSDAGEGSTSEIFGDCNDSAASINAGRAELCNAIDEDCNGSPTNGCPAAALTLGAPTNVGTAVGTADEPIRSSLCPAGYLLHGFRGRSGAAVDQIQARCMRYIVEEQSVSAPEYRYRLDTEGAVTYGTAFGGGGGTPFEFTCNSQSVITVLNGRAGGLVNYVEAKCSGFQADRGPSGWRFSDWTGSNTIGGAGGPGGSGFSRSCPTGSVAVGVRGTVNGDSVVGSLTLVCASIAVALQ